MDEKSARVLEFDGILEALAAKAATRRGADLCRNLRPEANASRVIALQAETAQACEAAANRGAPPFAGLQDVSAELETARIGGTLAASRLLAVSGTVRACAALHAYLGDLGQPALLPYQEALTPLPALVEEIESKFEDAGEMLDSASRILADLRRKMRALHNRILSRLQQSLEAYTTRGLLQDRLITLRSGRYCLPVKAERVGETEGIVHATSASGATVFLEPAEAVALGNEARILEDAEREEVERILHELTMRVGEHADEIERSQQAAFALDAIFARAHLSHEWACTPPAISDTESLYLPRLRHPLIPKDRVVPIDVFAGDDFRALVITGPNTGGKTVTLKSVGLAALMAQAGMHLPAAPGARLPVFDQVLADIGEEQSIEQSLSTFSSHISNVIRLSAAATARSLVLLDEVGSGTDPSEGAALGMALLKHFFDKGCLLLASTHQSRIKVFAWENPGFRNASVEFDERTLAPTFRLRIGVPGASNALRIAARLGLSAAVIADAEQLREQGAVQFDQIVGQLQATQGQLEGALAAAEEQRRAAEEERAQAQGLAADAQAQRKETLAKSAEEAKAFLRQVQRQAGDLLAALRQQPRESKETQAIQAELRQLTEEVRAAAPEPQAPPAPVAEPGPIVTGDRVFVARLKAEGLVIELAEDEAKVQCGSVRLSVPVTELVRLAPKAAPASATTPAGKPFSVPPALNLRGLTVEEALERLDKYLDDAFLAGLAEVRIIHGKGTGAVRGAVHEALHNHPLVSGFRLAEPSAGGAGVTLVTVAR
jgi:DNA mismatch repair protein MutS2